MCSSFFRTRFEGLFEWLFLELVHQSWFFADLYLISSWWNYRLIKKIIIIKRGTNPPFMSTWTIAIIVNVLTRSPIACFAIRLRKIEKQKVHFTLISILDFSCEIHGMGPELKVCSCLSSWRPFNYSRLSSIRELFHCLLELINL